MARVAHPHLIFGGRGLCLLGRALAAEDLAAVAAVMLAVCERKFVVAARAVGNALSALPRPRRHLGATTVPAVGQAGVHCPRFKQPARHAGSGRTYSACIGAEGRGVSPR